MSVFLANRCGKSDRDGQVYHGIRPPTLLWYDIPSLLAGTAGSAYYSLIEKEEKSGEEPILGPDKRKATRN